MIILNEVRNDFKAGEDYEWEIKDIGILNRLCIKVSFRTKIFFKRRPCVFIFDLCYDKPHQWIKHLCKMRSFAIVNPSTTNVFLSPFITINTGVIEKALKRDGPQKIVYYPQN